MKEQFVETTLVYGFLDAGKTTYIQDCILNGYFHKHGTTLILAFEQGEKEYDEALLRQYATQVACYEGGEDITAFCLRQIEACSPDRVYVEMNAMMAGLREKLPPLMRIVFSTTEIDWTTLPLYLANLRQQLNEMVSSSDMVTFRNCPSRELLAPYSQAFRLMNRKATYLRRDAMGYHERAFDLFVPYSLSEPDIHIREEDYIAFCLDAAEHPEHYDGKTLHFSTPLEIRQIANESAPTAGRMVMTCCMADLQFMGFPLSLGGSGSARREGWINLRAKGLVANDSYGRKQLRLGAISMAEAMPPAALILNGI